MSTFLCFCNYTIDTTVSPSPHEGSIIMSPSEHELFDKSAKLIVSYFTSKAEGDDSRIRWIRNYFGLIYPTDLSDVDIVHDIASGTHYDSATSIVKCPSCGRIYLNIEEGDWDCFAPEDRQGQ